MLGMQRDALNTTGYIYTDVSACFDLYGDYFAPQGNVIAFVGNESIQQPPTDGLLLLMGFMPRFDGGIQICGLQKTVLLALL